MIISKWGVMDGPTMEQTVQPAAMLDDDEYSAQRCLISIALSLEFGTEGHLQQPGM